MEIFSFNEDQDPIAHQNVDEDGATLLLVCAMFRLASQDIRFGDEESKEDALEFLESKWFEYLCDCLYLDSVVVRDMILHSKVKIRRNYE